MERALPLGQGSGALPGEWRASGKVSYEPVGYLTGTPVLRCPAQRGQYLCPVRGLHALVLGAKYGWGSPPPPHTHPGLSQGGVGYDAWALTLMVAAPSF